MKEVWFAILFFTYHAIAHLVCYRLLMKVLLVTGYVGLILVRLFLFMVFMMCLVFSLAMFKEGGAQPPLNTIALVSALLGFIFGSWAESKLERILFPKEEYTETEV